MSPWLIALALPTLFAVPLHHTLWLMAETMLEHTQGRLPI